MRLAPFVSLLALQACSPEPLPARPDASNDASDGAVDARTEATPCSEKRPSFVPSTWVSWDDYTPCSGFYVPTKTTDLPATLAWEACPPTATPAVTGCKSITLDPAGTGSAATDVSVDATGKAVVLFGQDFGDRQLFTVVDADGASVHAALLVSDRARFAVASTHPKSFIYPRYALNAVDMVAKRTDGVIFGAIGTVSPSAAHRWPTSVGNVVGAPGVLHAVGPSAFELMSFSDPGNKIGDVITATQSGALGNSVPQFFGDSLFWFGNANRRAIQRRWDIDTGPVAFIDYGSDDHGAGNLGTDGVDMVWLETHGPATKDAFWTTADYWTSPYAKNKGDLKPRRLRSEVPNALVGDPIVVGCGRAAFFPSNGVRIVNLNDGSSWFLAEPSNGWTWSTALALTCDEVFVRTASSKGATITSLPISNLGPASPAD